MFDIGWTEMAVIALLALVVIGPKDLPRVLRTMGQYMRKARALSREFQSGLNDVMREAELEDARKAIESTRSGQLDREIRKALDPDGSIDEGLRDLDKEARASAAASPTSRYPEPKASKNEKARTTQAARDSKIVKHPAGTSPEAAAAVASPMSSNVDEASEASETVSSERAQKTG